MDTDEYEKGVKQVSKSGESLASKLKSGLATAGKVAATGITAIAGAATASVTGLLALADSTEEYRIAQGRLNTAFEAAGYSAETAQEAYNGFYAILGDTDTATEASQLLAQLAESEEDVATWTQIAAGVSGTFGDSLPIESLIEATNETAKVGQVTGTLADALNWVGISEDEFNEKLAACSDESQRNQLIMQTLAAQYDEASAAFYRNNEALVESRNNQAQLDAALASLGTTVTNVKNSVLSELIPSISGIATAFNGILSGTAGAEQQLSQAVGGLVSSVADMLPEFMELGANVLTSLASGILENAPQIVEAITQSLSQVATMLPEIVTQLASQLSAVLPSLVTAGIQIVTALIQGISENLPTIIETIVGLIPQLVQAFIDNAPMLLEAGLQLILGLAQGLVEAIPQLIEMLPQLITSIIEFVLSAIPQLIEAGIQLFVALVGALPEIITAIVEAIPQIIDGVINAIIESIPLLIQAGIDLFVALIEALPEIIVTIVEAIPHIIESVIEALTNAIPQIIEAGFTLFVALIENLPQIIIAIVKAVPQIVMGIVNAFKSLGSKIVAIGEDLLRGVWEGIQNMAQWLWDKVKGFFSGIVDGVKGLLGINSPSKVFADMGKNMALGLGEGWDKEYDGIKKDIESGLNFAPGTVSLNGRSSVAGYGSSGVGAVNVYVTLTSSVNNQSEAEAVGRIIGEKAARQIRYKGGVSYA